MSHSHLDRALCQLRSASVAESVEQFPDGDLVQRFLEGRDEAAFAALVRRHGGLVLRVCRHVLPRNADAEDAFQAAFLILARKAASLRNGASLAGWLHGVAFRCAHDFRKNAMRRHKREQSTASRPPTESPLASAAMNELQAFLDEEIQRLSTTIRSAFVLCVLEGKGRAEAAQTLGCSEGTLASRLAKARAVLQKRLTARGVTLGAALCAVELSINTASAAASAALSETTTTAALAFTTGSAAGAVSGPAAAVAEGVLQSMFITKFKAGAVLMMAIGLSVTAAATLVAQPGAAVAPLDQKVDVFRFDFRNANFDGAIFPFPQERNDSGDFMTPEPAGLRFTVPNGVPNSAPIGLQFGKRISGDFQATFSYEILSGVKGNEQGGPGPQFYLMLDTPARDGISFNRQIRDAGDVMTVVHLAGQIDDKGKKSRGTRNYRQAIGRADIPKGKLRLIRQGANLTSQFAEGDGPFRDVGSFPIGTEDVRNLRIAADPRGRRGIDMRVLDFELTTGPGAAVAPAQALPPDPTAPRRVRLYWTFTGFCLFLVLVLIGLGLAWRRRRSQGDNSRF
jgi:RNA polymerase sigma factor (sigma-70 family)